MANYGPRDLHKLTENMKQRLDELSRDVTMDAFDRSTNTDTGRILTKRRGVVVFGSIPTYTNELRDSQVTLLNSTSLSGYRAHRGLLPMMEAGDVATIGWTAGQARPMHYKGWYWRDATARNFEKIVKENAIRIRKKYE